MIDLENGEQILLRVRRHVFFLASKLGALIPLAIIPIIIIAQIKLAGESNPQAFALVNSFYHATSGGNALIIFILFAWLLFLWVSAFIIWTDYYLDVLVITNHRIINIEQNGLFSRSTSSLHLDKIQDVSINTVGVLATFLSFGDLRIQTAGEVEEFVLHGLQTPDSVKKVILEQHEKEVERLRRVVVEKE